MVSKHSCLAKKKWSKEAQRWFAIEAIQVQEVVKEKSSIALLSAAMPLSILGRFTFVGWTVSGTAAIFFLYKRPINIQSSVLFLLGRQVECNIFEVHLIVVGLL